MSRTWIAGLAALMLACSQAAAQAWPERSVTVYVPFIAGSTPDAIARTVAERLQAKLGQPFVVENRPGASGNTGTAAVAKAAPDGHTLGVSIVGPLVINALLFPSMPYETAKDLAPVTILAAQPSVLVAYPGVAANSVPELLALLKADAAKFTYGSIGRGSLSHLAMEALTIKAGVKVVHLPFPGSPAVVTALLRGDVQLAVLPAGSVVPLGREGRLKMLGVTSPQRSRLLLDLPTLGEAGIAGVEADAWVGLIAPAATPAPVLDKIHKAAVSILGEPEVVAKLATQFVAPIANSPDEFRAVLKAEHDRWAPIIAAGGIKAE
ncbi:MAG TPA: tripartite tricarboxylate transporter substrate-binding protein [Hyphomicrobiaceae bacterium]|nr:tripartite tricarboxylate transporter substrate-binding protein [Hyphomicrobiaceae bacterium]